VSEVLDIAGLSDVAGRKVGTFSLGMNQRLGIAAALLGDPSTVMFDEPINGLDPEGIVWIRNLMKSLALEGRTVFLSSHLMSEMALTADHLIVIGRGSIIANASTDDFINRNTAPRIRVRALEQYELAEVLTQRGAVIERGSDDALVVTGLGAAAIGDAARIHDITLTELAPQGSTLEEAYFDLTKEVTDYNAGQLVDATKGA
jgi:ABC-2 type transport system ATP-binding protein